MDTEDDSTRFDLKARKLMLPVQDFSPRQVRNFGVQFNTHHEYGVVHSWIIEEFPEWRKIAKEDGSD